MLIVEDALSRWALPAARALHSVGWTVGVASSGASVAAFSRRVSGRHPLPPLAAGADAFVAAVAAVVRRGGYDLVIPARDVVLLVLSAGRGEFPAIFPYASHEVVVRSMDKLELARAAERVGLACPYTVPAEEGLDSWQGPAVVKPRLHLPGLSGPDRDVGTSLCADPAAAREAVMRIEALGGDAILQAPVSGRVTAIATVIDKSGAVQAMVQQEGPDPWPLGAGAIAYAHTVAIEEQLAARASALLRELGWFGLAQLQFLDDESGDPRLIDFNGRLYGSTALAIAAGVNLPAVWASVACERPVEVSQARVGVRYQWLSTHLRSTLATNQRGPVLSALRVLLLSIRSTHSLWAPSDPMPALRYVGGRLGKQIQRRLRDRG